LKTKDIKDAIEVHEKAIAYLRAKLDEGDTVLALIIDESGSMSDVRDTTISSINEYMQDRLKEIPAARFFLTKFNTETRQLFVNTRVDEFKPLTRKSYDPDGGTALLDAVGSTLESVETLNYKKVLVLIVTDGQENTSRKFNKAQIKEKIGKLEDSGHFTFVFMGANQDAWQGAQDLGMRYQGNTVAYAAASAGGAMRKMSAGTSLFMTDGGADSTISFASAPGSTLDLTNLPEDDPVVDTP
jgi:uncharacterized protein with von Willebrand factor type A (vWA) domain